MGGRKYRTKIEVLGDFLEAARQGRNKTRIIGLANLNPTSFQKYLEFCVSLDLIRVTPGGYRLTARADEVLEAIQGVLRESKQADSALYGLQKSLGRLPVDDAGGTAVLRYVSRVAWGQIPRVRVRSSEPSLPTSRFTVRAPDPWNDREAEEALGPESRSAAYLLPLATGKSLSLSGRRRPDTPPRE